MRCTAVEGRNISAHAARKKVSVPIAVRTTPRYSHQSNGGVEKYIRDREAQVRTLRSHIQAKCGVLCGSQHTAFPRMLRHAAWLISRFPPRGNVGTGYFRQHGVNYTGEVVGFGEVVNYRDPAPRRRLAKLQNSMDERHLAW